MDIFEKDKSGASISINEPEFYKIGEVIQNAQKILARLNLEYHTREEIAAIFSELTGQDVDSSFEMLPPFYTDFGKNIRIGKMCLSIKTVLLWTGAVLHWRIMCL